MMPLSLQTLTDETTDDYTDEYRDRLDETVHLWRALEQARDGEVHPRDRLRIAVWIDAAYGMTLPPSLATELGELMRDLTLEMIWRDDERIEGIMDRAMDAPDGTDSGA